MPLHADFLEKIEIWAEKFLCMCLSAAVGETFVSRALGHAGWPGPLQRRLARVQLAVPPSLLAGLGFPASTCE